MTYQRKASGRKLLLERQMALRALQTEGGAQLLVRLDRHHRGRTRTAFFLGFALGVALTGGLIIWLLTYYSQ